MASGVIGSLRVVLGIDSAQFTDGLRQAQKSLAGIGKSMTKIGAGLSAAVTAPIVAFGLSTVRVAGDFEASMNRVGAATSATGAQLDQMSKLALKLGADTSKSASESADMMEMLAKNGLSAQQILDGAAAAAIALSEATGGDLSRSADVATNVMAQFNLEVKDLPRIVDQITASTLNSQFGFEDYALALAQAGGVAGGLGVEIEDFNTVVTATADTFNSGSDAGTSFKTFLLSLTPTTSKARAAMENLGLEFFDAQGQMKSMADIAEELKTSFAGLSDTEISENMKTIFGTDSMRTAIALMNKGKAGLDEVKEGILQQGIAAEQQAARMKGFNGELEKLSGAFETLKISIANSGILEAVTQIVTKIADFVSTLSETNPEMLKWGTAIAAMAAALGPVILSVGLLVTALAAIGAPVAIAITAFASLVAGVIYFKDEITTVAAQIQTFIANGIDLLVIGLQNLASQMLGFINGALAQFKAAWDGITAKIAEVKASIVEFAASIPAIFADLAAQMVAIGGQIIQGLWDGLKSKMAAVKSYLVDSVSGMVGSVKSTLGIQSPSRVMQEVGSFMMQGMTLGIQEEQGSVVGAAVDTANKAVAASKDAWAGLRDVTTEVKGSFDSLFSSIGSNIADVIKGTKSFGDAIKDVLGQIGNMLVQQGLQGLFGGGGGIGGFFSSLFGGLFGFAQGGSFQVGGAGGIDSQLVAFKASPNERVSVTKPGQERHGGNVQVSVVSRFDANGNFETVVEDISQRTAAPMVRAGMSQANSAVVPTVAKYQNDRAGSDYRVA